MWTNEKALALNQAVRDTDLLLKQVRQIAVIIPMKSSGAENKAVDFTKDIILTSIFLVHIKYKHLFTFIP